MLYTNPDMLVILWVAKYIVNGFQYPDHEIFFSFSWASYHNISKISSSVNLPISDDISAKLWICTVIHQDFTRVFLPLHIKTVYVTTQSYFF